MASARLNLAIRAIVTRIEAAKRMMEEIEMRKNGEGTHDKLMRKQGMSVRYSSGGAGVDKVIPGIVT